MKAIPLNERPRERCLRNGARSISLRELLAILLGSGPPGEGSLGTASRILKIPGEGLCGSEEEIALFTALETSAQAHLVEVPGLGDAGQARILAAFELGRRYALYRDRLKRPRARPGDRDSPESQALHAVPEELRSEAQEWLGFVPVHRSGRVGGFCQIERGVRTHVNTDPVELFARVLALRPGGFYLFHNHPSGDLLPSPQDFDLTCRIERLARQLGVRLLGHAIVTSAGHQWIVV
jgi:DNA repair protein RadC